MSQVIVRIWPICTVHERWAFKPRDEAEWFKCAASNVQLNEPQQGHSLSGLYYVHQHLVLSHGITAQLWL